MKTPVPLLLFVAALLSPLTVRPEGAAEIKNVSVTGGVEEGKARLIIEGWLTGGPGADRKLIYSASLEQTLHVTRTLVTQSVTAKINILEGRPDELPLTIKGDGLIRQVTGEDLKDWSIRESTNSLRTLILRPQKTEKLTELTVIIKAETEVKGASVQPLVFVPTEPALLNGHVKVDFPAELQVTVQDPAGVIPINPDLLPEPLKPQAKPDEPTPLAFRLQGMAYTLPIGITLADPEARGIALANFRLRGQFSSTSANFTLSALARVKNPKGAAVELLSGNVALAGIPESRDWRVRFVNGKFVLSTDGPGEFPINIDFKAAVRTSATGNAGWNSVNFRIASASLAPFTIEGLAADTQFEFPEAAKPERRGNEFATYLPSDGSVRLSWKESRPEAEGKLFFSTEMLSQITVSPGLARQVALLQGKVMQGELSSITLLVTGAGEVTRVQGDQVLAWNVEPVAASADRKLHIRFNQAQKDQFTAQIQVQTPLGAFPETINAVQIRPEGATRFAGFFRIVNDGAVRLEVSQANGVSQVSPEQFPESDFTRAALRLTGNQRFVYRFSSPDFALRINADQILPELSVSQVLVYKLGENELAIDAEVELEIREAPLRELLMSIPRGYALSRVSASGLSDYFVREVEDGGAELRLVYGQPVSGRQLIQLRLEQNQGLGAQTWTLPRLTIAKAKSTRGHIGVSADAGYRLVPERTQGLTEVATAFFPRKIAGLQTAFRLSDPLWEAQMRVERLPQTVQADLMHLFSIGEGIAYGSSVINYLISGAPVSTFKIELSGEYFNVEFTGRDVRNWQKTTNGYTVQLHTPVSGPYTLLAAYERPFKAQGETLTFTGARPLDAQSEQGHTIITSAYQFQVTPTEVSPGLLPLETGEVPAEYRLFFDAPILAAYRYTARPFNLRLALSPLTQGDSLNQVVDRASLTTRISKEGQIVTEGHYYVKNRGNPNFQMTLPDNMELWSASVNGAPVVPVKNGSANLIPLPQHADPNALTTVDLKLASRSKSATRVRVAAPIVNAPVMLTEWKVHPDTGRRLSYQSGTLTPAAGAPDASGFVNLARTFTGDRSDNAWSFLAGALLLLGLAIAVWGWTARTAVYRLTPRHLAGTVVGFAALAVALLALAGLADLAQQKRVTVAPEVTFLAPVQQSGAVLNAEVSNYSDQPTAGQLLAYSWPALFALLAWGYAWLRASGGMRTAGVTVGWVLLAWAALRLPNGAPAFVGVLALFIFFHVAIPVIRALFRLPRRPVAGTAPASPGAAPAATTLLAGALFLIAGSDRLYCAETKAAAAKARSVASEGITSVKPDAPKLADTVVHEIRVEDRFAFATSRYRWQAIRGHTLPLLFEPAVLTGMSYPTNGLRVVHSTAGGTNSELAVAQSDGTFEIELRYQIQLESKDAQNGFVLPVRYGLVNRARITLVNLDVEVFSPQAVSVEQERGGSDTVANLVLSPGTDARIDWRPRSRDIKGEKPVFYVEMAQLYVPTAGVIEGVHQVSIRPAQGQLTELTFTIPSGTTITDVLDPAVPVQEQQIQVPQQQVQQQQARPPQNVGPGIALWRFDPDTRLLRVTLQRAQSKAFTLILRSQLATGPLPFKQAVGLVRVQDAAGQLGMLGVATGNEVQLEDVQPNGLSAINLEDFPGEPANVLQGQIAGLTVRRAFRYSDTASTANVVAAPVEPDVRVETQDTLSLGEDRTLLVASAKVSITRAGIFRLSFVMPPGFDVETISSPALSHWTESKADGSRVITLHLTGRTEGQQQVSINLAGPGVKATNGWAVPKVVFRETSKHTGTFLLVPEQGMRLQPGVREGITQLDPQRSGVREKGVLAFRILQGAWNLTLDIEQVSSWIQVTSLQHVMVTEAQLKVTANLQYQIENTGIKTFRALLPTNAEAVRFTGDQLADFVMAPGAITNGLQAWDIKLQRRWIGPYRLQTTFQVRLPEKATEAVIQGVAAADVNLQRGYVTVQSAGRLQLQIPAAPEALQPTEWQSVPKNLQKDLELTAANFAYRLVEPSYDLPLKLERHEAARLLPARVNSVELTSVISDNGVMLTHARLQILPGDKRLLNLTLPRDAKFWFAFVNQAGVWPWREKDRILIPLEQQSRVNQAIPVEFFFTSSVGEASRRELDLELLGPKFDLPLENITWRVSLSEKWNVKKWSGSLQLEQQAYKPQAEVADLQLYLRNEQSSLQQRTKKAEDLLAFGNSALEQGNPQQARRAFQEAYSLSTHDAAFNEDARVQLHNVKLQQALIGLNVRQAANDPAAAGTKLQELRNQKEVNFTQKDANDILARNTLDDNTALTRLAERIIQQQDAAVTKPNALRATVPEQGRTLVFKRAVLVDPWADLRIALDATAALAASTGFRLLVLVGTLALLGLLTYGARRAVNGKD